MKIVILSIFAILLSFLLFKISQRNKKKISSFKVRENKMVSKLKHNKTNTEKLSLNLAIIQDFVDEFSKRIKNIQSTIENPKDKEQITKLLRELQSYNRISNDVKKDSGNIKKINDSFVFNLQYKYPSLIEDELKICSLVYLKLKNKEIASLLNLSVRSIENKRYRIRKKMNLATSEDLFETLTSLNLD